jgi:hypothetical protein
MQSVRASDPGRMMSRLVVTVHRPCVFEDSLELLKDLTALDLKSPLKISFIDEHGTREAGIDGGGLFKDFIECLLRVRARSRTMAHVQWCLCVEDHVQWHLRRVAPTHAVCSAAAV